MGRYTSNKVFSDRDTKIVDVGAAASQSKHHDEQPQLGDNKSKKLVVDKVQATTSSAAGAGSGEFDIYRAARRRELTRLSELEAKEKEEREARILAENIERNKREADARTAKNAEKRLKKKQKKAELKRKYKEMISNGSVDEKNESES